MGYSDLSSEARSRLEGGQLSVNDARAFGCSEVTWRVSVTGEKLQEPSPGG